MLEIKEGEVGRGQVGRGRRGVVGSRWGRWLLFTQLSELWGRDTRFSKRAGA